VSTKENNNKVHSHIYISSTKLKDKPEVNHQINHFLRQQLDASKNILTSSSPGKEINQLIGMR
jgi:hypothetical protein